MPPPRSKMNPLTAEQIDLLRRWIDQGAAFDIHWAYVKPVRPPLPPVKNQAWVNNPIDAFIAAGHEAHGFMPAPEADRVTLLRRLSFDLTGLPPTPAEVETFLADTSAQAWTKQVQRLLASRHFGERLAMVWLDLVPMPTPAATTATITATSPCSGITSSTVSTPTSPLTSSPSSSWRAIFCPIRPPHKRSARDTIGCWKRRKKAGLSRRSTWPSMPPIGCQCLDRVVGRHHGLCPVP